MSLISVAGALSVVLFIVVPLAAVILVGTLTRGRARALGMAGFGVFVAEGVLNAIWLLVVPQLARSGSVPIQLLAGGYSAVRGLLSLVAIALLLFAVVVDRGRPVPAAR